MQPLPQSLAACVAVLAAGVLAQARLHRDQPRPLRPASGSMAAATLGMLLGLAVDASQGRVSVLVSLCGTGLPLPQLMGWHLDLLRAGNLGLVLGGVVALACARSRERALPTLLSLGAMLAGMDVGMPLLLRALELRSGPTMLPGMLLAMQAGMAWGGAAALLALRMAAPAGRLRPP